MNVLSDSVHCTYRSPGYNKLTLQVSAFYLNPHGIASRLEINFARGKQIYILLS